MTILKLKRNIKRPSIFALIDPRTIQVGFIGRSKNLSLAALSKMACSDHGQRWLDELSELGLEPKLEILEQPKPQHLIERHVWWIKEGLKHNWPLLNAHHLLELTHRRFDQLSRLRTKHGLVKPKHGLVKPNFNLTGKLTVSSGPSGTYGH